MPFEVLQKRKDEIALTLKQLEAKEHTISQMREFLERIEDYVGKLPVQFGKDFCECLFTISSNYKRSLDGPFELPTPSEAVRKALALAPRGISIGEIVSEVEGKFQTKSANPVKLIYSIVEQLRSGEQIVRGPDNRYRIPSGSPVDVAAYVGRWRMIANEKEPEFFITLKHDFQAEKANPSSFGTWAIIGDETIVIWNDGWVDILRRSDGAVVKSAFAPGVSLYGVPNSTQVAVKESWEQP